jgi:hypothetical protein
MRWLTLIVLVMLTGCSQLQQNADDVAARVADSVLPEVLDEEVSHTDSHRSEDRRVAAEDWLSEPGPPLTTSHVGATWKVRGSEGTRIRVDVYQYLESGDFFPPDQGRATWGVACRIYDVAEAVETSSVECPDGTPEVP